MAAVNTIKVKQIDNDDLLDFIQESLGQTIGTEVSIHAYDETFEGEMSVNGPFTVSGTSNFISPVTFTSGLISNSGIYVNGLISGQTLSISNFNLPSGSFTTASLGGLHLVNIPIYNSGSASVGAALPSGTVFGLRQTVNAPIFENDASGNLMPATGVGTSLVMLCVSMGS